MDPRDDGFPPNTGLSASWTQAWQWASGARLVLTSANFCPCQPETKLHKPEVLEAGSITLPRFLAGQGRRMVSHRRRNFFVRTLLFANNRSATPEMGLLDGISPVIRWSASSFVNSFLFA